MTSGSKKDGGSAGASESVRIEIPLDGTNADGTPRKIVVWMPKGHDSVDANVMVEALVREVRKRGVA